jgi:hypothetical protein
LKRQVRGDHGRATFVSTEASRSVAQLLIWPDPQYSTRWVMHRSW